MRSGRDERQCVDDGVVVADDDTCAGFEKVAMEVGQRNQPIECWREDGARDLSHIAPIGLNSSAGIH